MASSPSVLLVLLSSLARGQPSSSFAPVAALPTRSILRMSSSSYSAGEARRRRDYPRPLHPGGYTLPPLVEDRLSIATYRPVSIDATNCEHGARSEKTHGGRVDAGGDGTSSSSPPPPPRADLLLVKPPDMESLWEWYAHTRRRTDADPSWGRIWPTALSLSRWILRALSSIGDDDDDDDADDDADEDGGSSSSSSSLMTRAERAIRTSTHAIELGCGLGVAGLVYASSISSTTCHSPPPRASSYASGEEEDDRAGGGVEGKRRRIRRRTITFLDREPYALHCVMSSAAINHLATGPIMESPREGTSSSTVLTVRASVDDWTLPPTTTARDDDDGVAQTTVKNVGHRDLHLDDDDYQGTMLLLASDVLYEPSSMESLSNKLLSLVHPIHGGFALIADPLRERTPGCRDSFVECVKKSGGEVEIFPLPDLEEERRMSSDYSYDLCGTTSLLVGGESDVDIDGCLAKTMLIIVHYSRGKDAI